MSGQTLDKETMIKVYKFGSYYNPASNHYGNAANVVCDRCFKDNLDISIGWQTYDLCLQCINVINIELKNKSPCKPTPGKPYNQPVQYMTNMMQNQFTPDDTKVRMLQRLYKQDNDNGYKTYMMQEQFTPVKPSEIKYTMLQHMYKKDNDNKSKQYKNPKDDSDDDQYLTFMMQGQFY